MLTGSHLQMLGFWDKNHVIHSMEPCSERNCMQYLTATYFANNEIYFDR